MALKEVTDTSFPTEVLSAALPVLVDFWAPWCQPCQVLGPVLEELAPKYEDKLLVAKVNIDENPNTPSEYGVRGIPTLLLFKGGKVVATQVGALSLAQLQAFIDSNL